MAKDVKEMVAVRLDPVDRRLLKALSRRLRVSESEFLRYAIKTALGDFAPLSDQAKEGAALLPAFLQHPAEKSRFLGLDAKRLDQILNADLEDESLRVSLEDLELLVRGNGGKGYAQWFAAMVTGKAKPQLFMTTASSYLQEKYVEPLRD
jgi:hypothetical protein